MAEMTGLERVAVAITQNGQSVPDRVPVAPLVCGATHRFSGQTYGDWSRGIDDLGDEKTAERASDLLSQ